MGANAAQELAGTQGPPKRLLRNYLLDPRFQLKYTGAVVGVTVLVAAVLGYFAYDYSRGQTEALTIQMAVQPDLHPEVAEDLQGWAQAADRRVLFGILAGIIVLALALGVTGVLVTHKVVGPAYKMRRLLNDVAEGHLRVDGRLRKGDELQELFEAFARMVDTLRARQAEEVALLDAALAKAKAGGVGDDALAAILEVRDRMQAELD
jgi:methyl-accepting chemotaxis protein